MLHPRRHPVLLLLTLLAGLLAACDTTDTGPTDTVNAAIEHLRDGDLDSAATLTTDPATMTETDLVEDDEIEFLRAVTHHLSIEVLDQEIDGNEATVTVRVTNVSLPSVFSEFMSFGNMLTYGLMGDEGEELMMAALIENVRRDDAPTRTDETDAHLRKVDGEWLLYLPPTFNDDAPPFWNALFGYANDIAL